MRLGAALLAGLLAFFSQKNALGWDCSCAGSGQANVISCGAVPGDSTDDSYGINRALACVSASTPAVVTFPAGRYVLTSAVTSPVDGASLVFEAGTVFDLTSGGSLTVAGARTRLGGLVVRLATASTASFTAVTLVGQGTVLDGVRFEITADVPSATLLRISGDRVHASDIQILGDARSFAYGVHVAGPTGGEARWVRIDGIDAVLDPNDAHRDATFGALVYFRGRESTARDVSMYEGDRMHFPEGVIVMDGHVNTLENVNFVASGAQYGIFRKYGAEFLTLLGGRLDGTGGGAPRTANSEGICNEQFAGHLKAFGTLIVGWDYGVGFHGSHDTPAFFGAPIANNGTAAILIDSHYFDPAYQSAASDWPVTGLTISGVYFEEKATPNEAFLLLRSGALLGATITSSQIAVISRAIKVESTMGANEDLVITGNRFQASPGAALIEPSATSDIYYGPNATYGSPALTTGAYGNRVHDARTPTPSSLTLGSSDGPLTGHYRYVFTANFGSLLTAGASAELGFSTPAVAPTDSISCTVQGALASNANLAVSACYVTGWGAIALRMRNVSAVDQTGVSGNLFVDVWKH